MQPDIKIAGVYYQVRERSDEEMEGRLGTADFNRQLISINGEHTTQTKRIAIVHEVVHILSDAYGIKLTEQQVVMSAHALIAFLTDNPTFNEHYTKFNLSVE